MVIFHSYVSLPEGIGYYLLDIIWYHDILEECEFIPFYPYTVTLVLSMCKSTNVTEYSTIACAKRSAAKASSCRAQEVWKLQKAGCPMSLTFKAVGLQFKNQKKRFFKDAHPHIIQSSNISIQYISSAHQLRIHVIHPKFNAFNALSRAPWTGRWHGAPSASPGAPWKSSPVAPLADGHSRNPNWRHLPYISPM